MSRKPEQRLWDLLRPAFLKVRLNAMRVENLVDDGFPDIVVQSQSSRITFIETKARPEPPKRTTSIMLGDKYGLSQSQRNWWLRYNQFGGRRGLIVTRIGEGSMGIIYAHCASAADDLNKMTLEEFCDSALAVGAGEIAGLVAGAGWI